MEKMNMKSMDFSAYNVEKLKEIFPELVVEIKDEDGNIKFAIDRTKFDLLFNNNAVEGGGENVMNSHGQGKMLQ